MKETSAHLRCSQKSEPSRQSQQPRLSHRTLITLFGFYHFPWKNGDSLPSQPTPTSHLFATQSSSSNPPCPYPLITLDPPALNPSAALFSLADPACPTATSLSREAISWRSALISRDSIPSLRKLEFIIPARENSKWIASCKPDEIEKASARLEHFLQGFLIGKKPFIPVLRKFLANKWRLEGSLDLVDLDDGSILFKFGKSEEKQKVMDSGPHFVAGHALALRPWRRGMTQGSSVMNSIPVWILLPNLNLEFWSIDSLSRIGSTIGTPPFIDDHTANLTRLGYPRLCIEVSPILELPDDVLVRVEGGRSFTQHLKYEWKPKVSTICKSFFHTTKACSKVIQVSTPQEGHQDLADRNIMELNQKVVEENGWTVVKPKNDRKKPTATAGPREINRRKKESGLPENIQSFSAVSVRSGVIEKAMHDRPALATKAVKTGSQTAVESNTPSALADAVHGVRGTPPPGVIPNSRSNQNLGMVGSLSLDLNHQQETLPGENGFGCCRISKANEDFASDRENEVVADFQNHARIMDEEQEPDVDSNTSTLDGVDSHDVRRELGPAQIEAPGLESFKQGLPPIQTTMATEQSPSDSLLSVGQAIIARSIGGPVTTPVLKVGQDVPNLVSPNQLMTDDCNRGSLLSPFMDLSRVCLEINLEPNPNQEDSSDESGNEFPPGFTPSKEDMSKLRELMKEGASQIPTKYQKDFIVSVDFAEDGEILEFFQEKFKDTRNAELDTNYMTFQNVRRSHQIKKTLARISNSAGSSGLKKAFLR